MSAIPLFEVPEMQMIKCLTKETALMCLKIVHYVSNTKVSDISVISVYSVKTDFQVIGI